MLILILNLTGGILLMNKFSSKHFMFFIFAACLISIRSYSSIFIKVGGRDTWILSIIASILFLAFLLYLLNICVKHNTFNLNCIFSCLLPSWCSKIYLCIFSFGLFLTAIESISTSASSIHTNYFLSTPVWYCLLFLIIPTTYVLMRKLNAILIVVIVTSSLTLVGDMILLMLNIKYLNFSNLLPIMPSGMTSDKFLCLILILGSLSSVLIAFPYLSFIDCKKKLLRNSSLAFVICSFFILSSFVSVISFFGSTRAGNIFYPEYVESQRIQIANFIEFGQLFYIFRSVCMFFIKYVLASYAILLFFKDSIKNKSHFIIFYSTIIFILSLILTRNQYVLFNALEALQLILLITFILVPLICFTAFNFERNSRKKDHN